MNIVDLTFFHYLIRYFNFKILIRQYYCVSTSNTPTPSIEIPSKNNVPFIHQILYKKVQFQIHFQQIHCRTRHIISNISFGSLFSRVVIYFQNTESSNSECPSRLQFPFKFCQILLQHTVLQYTQHKNIIANNIFLYISTYYNIFLRILLDYTAYFYQESY